MEVGTCAKLLSFIDRLRFDRTIVDSGNIFLMDSEAVSVGASNKLFNGKTSWAEGVKGNFAPETNNARSSTNKSSALSSGKAVSIFCTT
jgi:hypothetical protein